MSIGFVNTDIENKKDLVVNNNFTNILFEGRTGTGKTSSAILPNIEDRIKKGYGVIVYDFKGNLHSQVKHLALKQDRLNDIIEIGKPWGSKINICDYLSMKQIPLIVNDSNDVTDSSYWSNASRNLLETIYSIYKNIYYIKGKFEIMHKKSYVTLLEDINKPSYKEISNIASSAKNVSKFYSDISSYICLIEEFTNNELKVKYKKLISKIVNVSNIITQSLKSLELYKKVREEDTGGKNAVVNHLNSILNVVASKDYLNESNMDLINELRTGKIVIIDVSSLSENILNLLNLSIYSRLQKVNDDILTPVAIFIDEAQKILSKDYLPQTDVCRESRFEYIFATQDQILLRNKIGSSKLDELLVNISSRFSFTTNVYPDLKKFECIQCDTNNTFFAKPIFINKKELFEAEYNFQKINKIYLFTEYKSNSKFILKYDEKVFENFKVLIEKKNFEIVEDEYVPTVKITNNIEIEETEFNENEFYYEEGEFIDLDLSEIPFIEIDELYDD